MPEPTDQVWRDQQLRINRGKQAMLNAMDTELLKDLSIMEWMQVFGEMAAFVISRGLRYEREDKRSGKKD